MREIFLVLCLVLGLVLGGGCSVAMAATASSTKFFTGPSTFSPGGVPASVGFDDVVPGFDWTYDHYSSADTKLKRAANASINGQAVSGMAGSRIWPAAKIAKSALGLAKLAGPVSLGLTLGELIWDEASKQWMKPAAQDMNFESATRAMIMALPLCPTFNGSGFINANPVGTFCLNSSSYAVQSVYQVGYISDSPTPPGAGWTYISNNAPKYGHRKGFPDLNVPPESEPATDAEIEDAIYTELVARGMSSDLARRLIEQGYYPDPVADLSPQVMEGPASVPGPRTTTTQQTPAGQATTVTQTTYNITYNNNTVNITETTTETKTNPDNTTETKTVTKEPGETPNEEEPSYSLDYQDAELPEVPDFYEQQYPDGFLKVWNDRKGEMANSGLASLATQLTSGAPDSGSCPSWTVSANIPGMGNYGSGNIAPPCYVWPWLKAILIITAFFAARRIIFGG